MPDEAISLVDHDAAWVARFAEQASRLSALLGPLLAGPIEHVGSTAVPGLRAKPIVDLLAPVTSLAAARNTIPRLTAGCSGPMIPMAVIGCGSCGHGRTRGRIICKSSHTITQRHAR